MRVSESSVDRTGMRSTLGRISERGTYVMGICIAHQECCREGISCTHSVNSLAGDDRLLIELAVLQRNAAAQPLGDDRDIRTQLLGPSGKRDALAIRQALS